MTCYIWHDSKVYITRTLYYPIRPREMICEWQRSDAGRSRDSDNMADVQ